MAVHSPQKMNVDNICLLIMKSKTRLLNRRILLLDRHLLELGQNFFNDAKDWRTLRSMHREEIQLIGFMLFSAWDQQYEEVYHLADLHVKKSVNLKLSQGRELALLDKLLRIERLN